MKYWHAIVRFFSLHPQRREGDEPLYTSTADVVAAIRRDHYNYGRRHTDTVGDVRAARAEREKVNKLLTNASTPK